MNRKLLKGGTVVSGSGSVPADVLIEGEKIAAVEPGRRSGVWRTGTRRFWT